MSSDYIPRLRAELVRAAERRQTRRLRLPSLRPLRPLAAVAAVALLVVAVVAAFDRGGGGSAQELNYSVGGGAASDRAAAVMRERLAAGGVPDATVSVAGDGRLLIAAPPAARAAVDALTQPGRLAFYDWEANVLGPDGNPAPADTRVTGGDDAGFVGALPRAEAEERAAQRRVARTVQAENGGGWFALAGEPALTNAELASAEPAVDPMTNEPVTAIEFTARGQTAFHALTRELARRGADERALQHFAIVIDDRIVSLPFIHYREVPDGIDGASGAQIAGDLDAASARRIAAILDSGPLPAELLPDSGG